MVFTYSGLYVYYIERRRGQQKIYEDIASIFGFMEEYAEAELLAKDDIIAASIKSEREVMRRALRRHYDMEGEMEQHLDLVRGIMRHMKH